jgi:hypothetical protein
MRSGCGETAGGDSRSRTLPAKLRTMWVRRGRTEFAQQPRPSASTYRFKSAGQLMIKRKD